MGTDFNYDDTDHQVIFDSINGGAGSGSLQEVSRAWQRLGDDVGVIGKSYVQSAILGVLASRTGAAAEEAAAATGAMLPWMDDVALIATIAAQRAQGQADYWVTAKHNVPPVPPAPVSAGFFDDPAEWLSQQMDWFPGLVTEEERALQRRQDAAEQARQAMRVYQSSSNGNIDPAPAFTAPQALDAGIGALALIDARVDGATSATVGNGQHPPTTQPAASQPATPQSATSQPAAHPMATYQPVATASQLAQSGPAAPDSVTPGSGRWAGNPTLGQSVASGSLPVSAGLGLSDSTAGRYSSRSVPDTAAGPGIGGAGGSAGAGGARGATSAGGAVNSAGFGPRPGVSAAQPGISAHPRAEGVTPVGARRSAGYEELLPAGGAGQRGDSDREREHRSKYLVHDDSNAIVGDLPPTAPPVIGEDPVY
ncbi:MAG: PPE domain-containing protein [Pseudonocardiaceae bacterium]